MISFKRFRELTVLSLTLVLILSYPAAAAAQKKSKDGDAPQGTPVLWKEPTDIATRDLFAGPGGDAMKPDLSKVTFESDEEGGYSIKWTVRDGAGKKWTAKLGKEAQPETVAVRLVWAAGYMTEINYLATCVHIAGAPKPRHEVDRCEGDGFANVRFKRSPEGAKKLDDNWSWNKNPFVGTKEFKGLVVLMGLLNNWDLKDPNNKIYYVPGADAGQGELQYVVADLGATFGKTGGPIAHDRNEPEHYVKSGFVEKVEGGRVKFDYHGKNAGLFDNISVEDAKWIGDILSQLSEQQIKDAFRAGNFKPDDIEALSYEVRARINELHSIEAPASTGQSSQQ